MTRPLHALVVSLAALLAYSADAHAADCTEAGACASNEYCATAADGGTIVTDGGAGVCVAEPCVASSDCPNDELCDTSQNPFKCVECISTADCPGDLLCDVTTRTCVEPPPDAGPPVTDDDAGPTDAGTDATVDGSAPPVTDGSTPPPSEDSGTDAGPVTTPDAGFLDTGTLNGGACDCATVVPAHMALGALGAPILLALSFLGRRRRRRR